MRLSLILSFSFLLSSIQLGCYPDRDPSEPGDTPSDDTTPAATDAGATEGTTDDHGDLDAGATEGATDGNGDLDAGATEGATDGDVDLDAGATEGTTDGDVDLDAGTFLSTSCGAGDYMLSTMECAPCPEETYQPNTVTTEDITACLPCDSGYSSASGSAACNDIDECANNTDDCDENADCTNTNGSYACACGFGYIGNGLTCEAIVNCIAGEYITSAHDNNTNPECAPCPGFPHTLLSSNMVENGNVNTDRLRIDPTSQTVAYHGDGVTDNYENIFTVPIAGGNPSIADNRSADSYWQVGGDYHWTHDGKYLIYQDIVGSNLLLYKAEPNSQNAPIQLAPNEPNTFYFKLNSTNSHVVYNDSSGQLFSASLTGADAIPIGSELASNTFNDFLISPDGQTVVYKTQPSNTSLTKLFSVDIEGESTPIELTNFAMTIYLSNVLNFAISPDGNYLLFTYRKNAENWDELYSVPIGGGTPIRLNNSFVGSPNNGEIVFKISPNSQKVVYLADQNSTGARNLYVAPINSSNAAAQINDTIVPGGQILDDFEIDKDGTIVTYRGDITTQGATNLYASATSGLGSLSMVSPLCSGCEVIDFKLHVDTNYILYRVSDEDGQENIFYVSNGTANGIQINKDLEDQAKTYNDYRFSNDGTVVFYSAQQELSTRRDLFAYFLERNTYRRLNDPYDLTHLIWHWDVSPDGAKIAYIIGPVTSANTKLLYSAFVEGGTFTAGVNEDTCSPWTICAEDEYVSQAGTSSSDQVCSSCETGQEPGITNAENCLP